MVPLPRIMVAPNGARLQKADHPALPISIEEVVETAKACEQAGADGIHAHVRDDQGQHVLDAGLYRELLAELKLATPVMYHQITTEAVGRYTPVEQVSLVRDVKPDAVSVALRELQSGMSDHEIAGFFDECLEQEIDVQHILYVPQELDRLIPLIAGKSGRADGTKVLFVLGRYAENQQSHPKDLEPFTRRLADLPKLDWAVCAFGIGETEILEQVLDLGGKVRVGFENNLVNRDGKIAASNDERVRAIVGK